MRAGLPEVQPALAAPFQEDDAEVFGRGRIGSVRARNLEKIGHAEAAMLAAAFIWYQGLRQCALTVQGGGDFRRVV